MYLKNIYMLTEHGGRARTTDIAAGWQVAPSSATEMIRRLAERGFVHHEPYRGVELTDEGRRRALRIIRKNRLLEVFLTREVDLGGEDAYDAACEMEHALPDSVEVWMCTRLGHPTENPKGEPIPPGRCCPRA